MHSNNLIERVCAHLCQTSPAAAELVRPITAQRLPQGPAQWQTHRGQQAGALHAAKPPPRGIPWAHGPLSGGKIQVQTPGLVCHLAQSGCAVLCHCPPIRCCLGSDVVHMHLATTSSLSTNPLLVQWQSCTLQFESSRGILV
jgi:hypothetical protein